MKDKTFITDSHHQNREKNDPISETGIMHLDVFSFNCVGFGQWLNLPDKSGGNIVEGN